MQRVFRRYSRKEYKSDSRILKESAKRRRTESTISVGLWRPVYGWQVKNKREWQTEERLLGVASRIAFKAVNDKPPATPVVLITLYGFSCVSDRRRGEITTNSCFGEIKILR